MLGFMRRMFRILLCGVFLFSATGNVYGVEKKSKEKKKTVKVEKKKVALKKPVAKKSTKAGKSKASQKKLSKKYNKFIDKNKNGIDDRKENLKAKKTVSKKKPKKKKS